MKTNEIPDVTAGPAPGTPRLVDPSNASPRGLTFDEETHVYRLDGEPILSVTQILSLAGFDDWMDKVPEATLTYASARGTAVHKAIKLQLEGTLDPGSVDEEIKGYLWAFSMFRRECGFKPDPKKLEYRFVNRYLRYAGTLDCEGRLGAPRAIVDWKSGGVNTAARLQLAGYQARSTNRLKRRRIALQLRRDGTYRVYEFPLKDEFQDHYTFLAALRIANFRVKHDPTLAPWS